MPIMPMPRYMFVRRSGNMKTGPIAVTTTSRDSCPDACPFRGNGCYADSGPLRLHWDRLSDGRYPDIGLGGLAAAIRRLKPGSLWRHNQAGDLAHDNGTIDRESLQAITAANQGRRGFTYTHHALTEANVAALTEANRGGFTVNVSTQSPAEAVVAMAMGLPAVVVVPEGTPKVTTVAVGSYKRRIVVCPATYQDDTSCADCGLCQRAGRDYAIAFPVHGNGKRKARSVIDAAS